MQGLMKRIYHRFDLNILSNFSVLATCLFVGLQTCSLNKQVKISIDQLESQIARDRPFITVEPKYTENNLGEINRLEYIIVNYGNIPGQIICSINKISFTETKTLNRSDKECDTTQRVVYPTVNNRIFALLSLGLSSENMEDF
jgi:hypothetical protein